MRYFTFLTLLIIVESVYSHSSNFLSHARRSMDIIKRQGLLGPPSPSQTNSGGGGGGLLGGILGGNPSPTAAAPAATSSSDGGVVGGLLSPVAPVASALNPVVKPVTSALAPVVSPVASAVAPVVSPVASAVAPVVSPVASAVAPVVSPVASAVAPVVKPVASVVGSVVSPVASAAAPVASVVGSVVKPVATAAAPVVSVVGSAAAPVVSVVGSAAAPVVSVVGSAAAPVVSVVGSAAAPVVSVVTSAAAPVVSVVTSAAAPVVSVLTSAAAPVVSVVTSAVAPVASIPLPNSGTPTVTPPPETPTITSVPDIPSISSASLISVISFPQPSTATAPTITTNPPLEKTTTMSIDSQISFILTVSSLALTSAPTTPAITLTNPDQASSSALPTSAVPTTSLPLPSGMPARIYPPDRLDPNTDLTGYTFIAILFDLELNWPFVVSSSISSTQIFAYIPIIIATALGIETTQILTWALQVYIPTSYQTPADAAQLGTLWLGYVPSNFVTTLSQEILAKQSKFYTGESDAVARALASHVNSGFDILSVSDPNPGGPSSGDGGKSRRDAIIGVVSSLGGIAFFVLVFLAYRMMKNRRDHAHRRLSEPDADSAGVRPEGQDFDQDSVGGARRRSFYYAEDSLRDSEPEQIAGPSVMTERRTVAPGTSISAPVLQESSLNW